MYIQRIIYDQSCSFVTTSDSSAEQNSLFNLTKEYVYIVNCEDCIDNEDLKSDKQKNETSK